MFENILAALKNFIKMLNLSYEMTGELYNDLVAMEKLIADTLREGAIARDAINGHTPLMLYACFNIIDTRFENELKKGVFYITQTIALSIDEYPKPHISALTFAAGYGSVDTLQRLYETKLFSEKNLEQAVFFAAAMGRPKCVAYLRDKGVNLFLPVLFNNMTPLHVACMNGYVNVAKEILDSNPKEELVSMVTFMDSKTAYQLALEGGKQSCVDLLKNTKSAVWIQIEDALRENNHKELSLILDSHPELNLTYGSHNSRYISLLGASAYIAIKENSDDILNAPVYRISEEYHLKQSITAQFNGYILGLSFLMMTAKDSVWFSKMYKHMLMKLNELISLESNLNELTSLMINGFNINDELFNNIMVILQHKRIESIDLTSVCHDILDEETDNACSINLWNRHAVQFVAALVKNSVLLDCQLLLTSSHQSIVKLVDLIVERNNEMTKFQIEIMKDKIYNKYVARINSLITEIKGNEKINGSEILMPIKTIERVYSLKNLVAFSVANNKNHTYAGQDKITKDCDSLITQHKL